MTTDPSLSRLRFTLNGSATDVPTVPGEERLLDLLRWRQGLKGTKEGCRSGDCGACTVLLDGESTLSCLTLAHEVEGRSVETIEGLAAGEAGRRVAEAFARAGAVQCGYCTPGFVMAVAGWMRERSADRSPPSAEEMARELGGNLCRCTGYYGILRALGEVVAGTEGESALPRSRFEVVEAPEGRAESPVPSKAPRRER